MSSIWKWDETDFLEGEHLPRDDRAATVMEQSEELADEVLRRPDAEADCPGTERSAVFGSAKITGIGRATQTLPRRHKASLLGGVPLFSRCTDTQLAHVAGLTIEGSVPAGTVLAKRGEPGLELFVVVEGHAIVARKGMRLAVVGPGSFFGELALLDGGKRTVTVVAETDMHLLVLQRREFNSLYQSCPSIIRKVVTEVGARLRGLDDLLDPSPAVGPSVGPWSL